MRVPRRAILFSWKACSAGRRRCGSLFPVNGQVFYEDPTLPSSDQGIPLMAAARGGATISLFVDGAEMARGVQDPSLTLPLEPGPHVAVARTSDAEDRVLFEVK